MVSQSSSDYLRLENRHTGEILELQRRREDGEPVISIRGSLPPHEDGPPMHMHLAEDEAGMVTAGTLSVEVGGDRRDVRAGELLRLPRRVPHRWWNQGETPLMFEGEVRPAVDLDRYLQAVFEVVNAGPRNRPPLIYMAHVALRHRDTQVALLMWRPLQVLVLRVAYAIGTLLGRYRGSDWPGCPERCTGAPWASDADQQQ